MAAWLLAASSRRLSSRYPTKQELKAWKASREELLSEGSSSPPKSRLQAQELAGLQAHAVAARKAQAAHGRVRHRADVSA